MNENKKKKKLSFNVLDVFVILLVVILILTAVYKITQASSSKANEDNPVYMIEFECTGEYNSLVKYLSDGEEIYLKSTGELLGYLYRSADFLGTDAIFVIQPENDGEEDNGSQAGEKTGITKDPHGVDIYRQVSYWGKIKLNGNFEKSHTGAYYSLGDLNITVGSVLEVYTDDTLFTLTVKRIIDKKG